MTKGANFNLARSPAQILSAMPAMWYLLLHHRLWRCVRRIFFHSLSPKKHQGIRFSRYSFPAGVTDKAPYFSMSLSKNGGSVLTQYCIPKMRRSVFTHPVHIQFQVLVGLDSWNWGTPAIMHYMFGVELFQRFCTASNARHIFPVRQTAF